MRRKIHIIKTTDILPSIEMRENLIQPKVDSIGALAIMIRTMTRKEKKAMEMETSISPMEIIIHHSIRMGKEKKKEETTNTDHSDIIPSPKDVRSLLGIIAPAIHPIEAKEEKKELATRRNAPSIVEETTITGENRT